MHASPRCKTSFSWKESPQLPPENRRWWWFMWCTALAERLRGWCSAHAQSAMLAAFPCSTPPAGVAALSYPYTIIPVRVCCPWRMPSANPKLEKQASTEAVEPIRLAITVIEHKIRNLEKRKVRLYEYKKTGLIRRLP